MIDKEDVPTFFRDLYYTAEQELFKLKDVKLPKATKDRIKDNLVKKQVMVTRMIALYLNQQIQ